MTAAAIDDVIKRWAAAELAGDHGALDDLITDDFLFVGPLGFMLDREQWLERFHADRLHYTRFAIEDVRMRTYDAVAVVVGVQDQDGDHEGRPVRGRFRLTLVVTTAGDRPRIAGGHLSPIAAPPS
jgi:ketosteroid isomerase-like protein